MISDKNESSSVRQIFQYQFLGWEDQSCPSGLLLNYLEDINTCVETKVPPDSGPIIVHCSAGIGRTGLNFLTLIIDGLGTFIVLDIILAKIKLQGPNCPVDVFKTVRMIREQRANMVQIEAQYRFIYEAISKFMKNFRNGLSSSSSNANSESRREMNGRQHLQIDDY